jgi:hypothetical protein
MMSNFLFVTQNRAKNSQKLSRPNAPEQPRPPKPTAQVDAGETNKADFMFNQAMGMMNQTQNQNQNQNNQIVNPTMSQPQNPIRDNLSVKPRGAPGIHADNFQARHQSMETQMPNLLPVANSNPKPQGGDIFSQLGGMGMKAPVNSGPQKPMNVQYFSENLEEHAPRKSSPPKPPASVQKPQPAQPAKPQPGGSGKTQGAGGQNLVDQFSMFQQELNNFKKQKTNDSDADPPFQNTAFASGEKGPATNNLANQPVTNSQRKLLSRDSSGFSVSKYSPGHMGAEGQKTMLQMSPVRFFF